MIHSIFEHLKGCINSPVDQLYEKLDECNIHLFEPLWNESDGDTTFTRDESAIIILYIIFAYSQHSDWLTIGSDAAVERVAIANRVNLPEYLHGKVIKLGSKVVRRVVIDYLNTQSSRAFKYLSFKKDLYEAAMESGIASLKDKDGNVDLKAMSDADKYMGSLLKDMNEYEDQLRAEYKFVFENNEEIAEIDRAVKRKADTGNIENSSLIT